MKTTWHRSLVFGCVVCGSLVAVNVMAEDFQPHGYVGAAVGRVDVNDSEFEDDDTSEKVYVGGKFGRYVGIEASVNDFGESSNAISGWELDGKTLAIVGFLPVNDRFGFFIKAGNLWWDADVTFMDLEEDFDGSERFGGIGGLFNFTDMFSMRAEYERYDVELEEDEIGVDVDSDSKVNVASLGLQFNF